MQVIDRLSDGALTAPFVVLSLITALVVIYVMQSTWHDASSQRDGVMLNWLSRIGYILVSLALVWGLTATRAPTLAEFCLVIGLFLMFSVRAVILFYHRHDTVVGSSVRQLIH